MSRIVPLQPPYEPEIQMQFDHIMRGAPPLMLFRVIAGNTHPDHCCISEFRRVHLSALADLFVQVLRLCQRRGWSSSGMWRSTGRK